MEIECSPGDPEREDEGKEAEPDPSSEEYSDTWDG